MKLLRYGEKGSEKPGLLDADGTIRDLSGVIPDIAGAALTSASLAKLKGLKTADLPKVDGKVRLGPCVGHVGHFIAVGLNFEDHAKETNSPIPKEPILFDKASSCIVGPDDDIVVPPRSTKLDWEVELAIVIGDGGYDIPLEDAMKHVAGYCVCNDVSERAWQIEGTGQWTKGKSAPTFGPIGPWVVTTDEVPDTSNLAMWLEVNGQKRQNGSTKTMIFDVPFLVSYISRFMALESGDVITTGTPPGVGLGMKPPTYLQAGDTIRLGIAGLGEQHQKVVPYKKG
jgi:2-keto-4-pentenoate hydratase/2-oxohepta-3-ene-1,7-dioic acid hydratase in catechol pathway